MNKKIRLPKEICAYLDESLKEYPTYEDQFPFVAISVLNEKRGEPSTNELQNAFAAYVNLKKENQWKIIEAIQRGYEPEPEQLYYVDFGKAFGEDRWLNKYDKRDYYGLANKNEPTGYKTRYTMPEIEAVDQRYKAFAVKVEEVDNCD